MNARAPALTGLPTTEGPFVIAEAGVNHNGDAALAMRMVDAARDAGAHAIKFQTFVPELLASPVAPRAICWAAAYADVCLPRRSVVVQSSSPAESTTTRRRLRVGPTDTSA